MGHHREKVRVSSMGTEVRLRRHKKSAKSRLTKGSYSGEYEQKNPDPIGKPGPHFISTYPLLKKRRKERSEGKRIERKIKLKRAERLAFKENE